MLPKSLELFFFLDWFESHLVKSAVQTISDRNICFIDKKVKCVSFYRFHGGGGTVTMTPRLHVGNKYVMDFTCAANGRWKLKIVPLIKK